MMQTIQSNPGVKGFTLLEMMIVVCIVGVLATMAAPSFRRMINNMQVERLVQQLQMEEQAFKQFAIFNRGYPPSADPGVLPPGLQEYLPSGLTNWGNVPTSLGGNWKWEGKDSTGTGSKGRGLYFEFGISISKFYSSNPLWPPSLFREVDRRIDDGNLSTGAFRSNNIAGNSSIYSYALQSNAPPIGIWGTAQ
jgi:prepilin-type N-terminal cleavage/methylation domain-containing protein